MLFEVVTIARGYSSMITPLHLCSLLLCSPSLSVYLVMVRVMVALTRLLQLKVGQNTSTQALDNTDMDTSMPVKL